jgi:glycosyltransferase 2 family protein
LNRFPWILKLALSAALIAAVLFQVNLAEVLSTLTQVRPEYAIVCLLVALPIIAISAWRWMLLAQATLSFRLAIKYILIGLFYGSIMPGSVSGDVARGVALAAKERSMRIAVLPASILADRLLGVAALLLLATAAFTVVGFHPLPHLSEYQSAATIGAALSASLAVIAVFPFCRWFEPVARSALALVPFSSLRSVFARAIDALAPYSTMPGAQAKALGLSFLVHFFTLAGYVFAFLAFDITVDLLTVVIFYSSLSFILLLPVSISGIGVREVFAIFFFKVLDQSAEQAVAFSLFLLLLSSVIALSGAAVQVWELYRPSKFVEKDA